MSSSNKVHQTLFPDPVIIFLPMRSISAEAGMIPRDSGSDYAKLPWSLDSGNPTVIFGCAGKME